MESFRSWMLYRRRASCRAMTALPAKNPETTAVTPSWSLCEERVSANHGDISRWRDSEDIIAPDGVDWTAVRIMIEPSMYLYLHSQRGKSCSSSAQCQKSMYLASCSKCKVARETLPITASGRPFHFYAPSRLSVVCPIHNTKSQQWPFDTSHGQPPSCWQHGVVSQAHKIQTSKRYHCGLIAYKQYVDIEEVDWFW